MSGIADIFRRFGGATLLNALPEKDEFEKRLQVDAEFAAQISARVRSIEIEIENQYRSGIDNAHHKYH